MFKQIVIQIKTHNKSEILDVTDKIESNIVETGINEGLLNIYLPHTTASVTINENDLNLWFDISEALQKIAPHSNFYHHRPNADAHILTSLIKPSVTIPFTERSLNLGTYQRILLIELDGPRTRTLYITLLGENKI
jgi:secondary thiamine-phosphate synthase enzyme